MRTPITVVTLLLTMLMQSVSADDPEAEQVVKEKVAVVSQRALFENHAGFIADRAAMNRELIQVEAEAVKKFDDLQAAEARAKAAVGIEKHRATAEYERRKRESLEFRISTQRKFLAKERKIYQAATTDAMTVVDQIARKQGCTLVIFKNKTSDRDGSIVETAGKNDLISLPRLAYYQDVERIDLTDDAVAGLLQLLKDRQLKTESATPAVPAP